MTSRHKRIVGQDRAQRVATGDRNRTRGHSWASLPDRPTRATATNRQLASVARERAAAEPAGSLERRAWGCLAVALGTTGTVSGARRVLELAPAEIRTTALDQLDHLTIENGDNKCPSS